MNIINPLSSSYHAVNDFSNLSAKQAAAVILATGAIALLTLPLLGLPAVAVFRSLVKLFQPTEKGQDTSSKIHRIAVTKEDAVFTSKPQQSKPLKEELASRKGFLSSPQFVDQTPEGKTAGSESETKLPELNKPKAPLSQTIPSKKAVPEKTSLEAKVAESGIPKSDEKIAETEKQEATESVATVKIAKPFIESAELKKINQDILVLREQIESLSHQYTNEPIGARKLEILDEKQQLIDQHTELTKAKVEFVKTHFPDNPIYALAIPQTLKKGMILSTAGKKAKIESLKEKGIIFNPALPATGLDPSAVLGPWGINEMGDRGIYFSEGEPAYLGDEYPIALGCQLTDDASGISIMPLSTLRHFGFTNEQINKGFDQLQKEFNFLQHDGTYPSNTEIIFVRNDNLLQLSKEYKLNIQGDVVKTSVNGPVHSTWKAKENPNIQVFKKSDFLPPKMGNVDFSSLKEVIGEIASRHEPENPQIKAYFTKIKDKALNEAPLNISFIQDVGYSVDQGFALPVKAGIILQEPDGRIWIRKVANNFGGYAYSFPKGGLEKGLSLQQNALKELYEETGMLGDIQSLLTDYKKPSGIERYYIANRAGGTPTEAGWESEFMVLVEPEEAINMLNVKHDKNICHTLIEARNKNKSLPSLSLNGPVIKQIDDQGRCIVFDNHLNKNIFFKPLRGGQKDIVIEAEIAASSLANRMMGNLIPASYRAERNQVKGLGQEALDFSKTNLPGAIGTPGASDERSFNIQQLTQPQLEQLFAHSLVDWIISNTDVFPHNFGIDKQGNVVGFDKGQAFKYFKGSRVQTPHAALGIESSLPTHQPNFDDLQEDKSVHVHALLRDQLKSKQVAIDFSAPIIQQTISSIKNLKKDEIKEIFGKYASLAFPGQEEAFIDSVWDRCQDLERAVNQFKTKYNL
ncbi:NUDIX hydrolase [Candidatus Protochlamydia phocaeensis]|uniref:NUDIX hydrolase n=1 Tax=Candidatus Protochlamydia phocaeensis TaxID=1414722 RepID=UPI000837BCDF|nr:NUDIX hydrolase [Candidatus Protochlamydia phocaeensis]